jgi:predicted transcriptional regulator YheO
MDRLKAQGNQAEDMLDYLSLAKDGRQLKSSTVFIRNESGEIVGCLCYNLDLTELRLAQKVISGFTAIKSNSAQDAKGEIFAQEISDVVGDIIQYEITKTQKPVTLMSRGDKLRLISSLDAKGVFDVKGSAEMTAQFLGSSVFTVYNYLKEIRSAFKQGQ